ncbi:hypothetical protein EG68_11803 [Paragonimus skrjabini miyazakii]|uniref:Uncharacterized protein n=1 Tax=Paragonimus skrjabini miyazakii TaxID=59628 RepID=A0A8S9YC93_9TREM|nr:hypothetical protein EG68_11803 [Paragonimus skrjabini miyazakii]
MTTRAIPGYYYDEDKKRYFKIAKQNIPDFISRTTVNATVALKESNRNAHSIRSRCLASRRLHLLRMLSVRERRDNCLSSRNLYSQLVHAHAAQLQHKFVSECSALGKCLLSPDGRHLYVTKQVSAQSYCLATQRISYNAEQANDKTVYNIESLPPVFIDNHGLDLVWLEPGRQLAVLGSTGHQASVKVISCVDELGLSIPDATCLPFRANASARFVTPVESTWAVSSSSGVLTEQRNSRVFVLNGDKLCSFNRSGSVERFNFGSLPFAPFSSDKRRSMITALGHAGTLSPCTSPNLLFYIASSLSGLCSLDLLRLSFTSSEPGERLIHFTLSAPGGSGRNLSNTSITFLQSLTTPVGDRIGLLVGHRSGLLQLWDDRWPTRPAVEYFGSDGGLLQEVASHLTPVPTVSPLECDLVASPLLASAHIGLWRLRTGQPLTVLEIPQRGLRSAGTPPPQIFFRPRWPNSDLQLVNGPTVLAVDQGTVHLFHEDGPNYSMNCT